MTDSIRRGKTTAFLDSTPTEYRIDMTEAEVRQRLEAARAAHITDLLGTQITDAETIELLPTGSGMVDDDGDIWQKQADGWWYPASFSWIRQRGALAIAGANPTLIWLPPEVTQ